MGQRQQQLNDYVQNRVQHISAEIRQSVVMIELRLKQTALAKEHVAYTAERVRELEGRGTAGKSNFLELSLARLRLLQAKADVVSRVVGWKVADVRLRENQGRLLDECAGFCAEHEMQLVPSEAPPMGEIIREEPVLPPPPVQQKKPVELPAPKRAIEEPAKEEAIPTPVIPEETAIEEPAVQEPSAKRPRLPPAIENTASFALPELFQPRSVGGGMIRP
jgi:hypothetical protein